MEKEASDASGPEAWIAYGVATCRALPDTVAMRTVIGNGNELLNKVSQHETRPDIGACSDAVSPL